LAENIPTALVPKVPRRFRNTRVPQKLSISQTRGYTNVYTHTNKHTNKHLWCIGRRCCPVRWPNWWARTRSNGSGGRPPPNRWSSGSGTALDVTTTAALLRATWSATTWCRTSSTRPCVRPAARACRPWAAWWARHHPRGRTWARSSVPISSSTVRATWCRRAWSSSATAWTDGSDRPTPTPTRPQRSGTRCGRSTCSSGPSTTATPGKSWATCLRTSGSDPFEFFAADLRLLLL